MASVRTKMAVGIFVVAGFAMVVFTVIWLGMSNYLEKGKFYVAYFDETVQGLDRDSPVKYRGVSIGKVHSIGVAPDARLIRVVLKIETGLQLDKSIVAELKAVGITGLMYVELEKKRAGDILVSQREAFPSPYPVIDTRPSEIRKIMGALNDVLVEFKGLDIKGILQNLNSMLAKMEQTMDDAQLKRLSGDMRLAIEDIRQSMEPTKWRTTIDAIAAAVENIDALSTESRGTIALFDKTLVRTDGLIADNAVDIQALIAGMRTSLDNINRLTVNSNRLVEQSHQEIASLAADMKKTLKSYEKAGKSLDRFLERIADQPSQLFLGEPPVEKSMGSRGK
ncbi:MAG: MlaD family protein [Deltaproteobacteria bacterium]|nr:MlaD family protein [Deltaproteobacteria bacterium]